MTKRSNLVQSVIKAVDILETLDNYGELGISEISNILDLDKSTVHRIISTLRHKEYVIQNSSNQKYSNSFKFWEIGNNVVERLGIRRQAQPFMEDLVSKSFETVNLAVMDGKHIIYIDKIESTEIIKANLNVGKRLPVYCTGLGKAILSFLPVEKVKELLKDEDFIQYTDKTISNLQELIKHLSEIQEKGYCVDDEEYMEGIICIASPVMNYTNEVVAAISIAVPKFRIDNGERDLTYLAKLVKGTATKLSQHLGFKCE